VLRSQGNSGGGEIGVKACENGETVAGRIVADALHIRKRFRQIRDGLEECACLDLVRLNKRAIEIEDNAANEN
jgi:hypothetical protein